MRHSMHQISLLAVIFQLNHGIRLPGIQNFEKPMLNSRSLQYAAIQK